MSNCACHSHPNEEHERNIKWFMIRILISLSLIVTFSFVEVWYYLKLAIFIAAFLIAGFEVFTTAIKNLFKGKVFDENFLMSVASIAAFAIGDFVEAVAVMIFYGVGELLQDMSVKRSRANIVKLMDIRPDYANKKVGDEIVVTDPRQVEIGDIIIVRAGEKIALDGIVVAGQSFIDTKAITGEPVPQTVKKGDAVFSGTINTQSELEIKVTKLFGESTVSKILELVEHASSKKSNSEKFITKFAKIYTPIVIFCALAVAILPPLLGFGTFSQWIYRAISFLLISCPCALVISIPVGVFGGIGGCARNGILIKGGNYLEALNSVKTLAFDKTGTLTLGVFDVIEIKPENITAEELLHYTAIAEQNSNHPIAKSILAHYGKKIKTKASITEEMGMGLIATTTDKTIHAGNQKLMAEIGLHDLPTFPQTTVYVAINKVYVGYILIADKVKPSVKESLAELYKQGIKETIMLTGDNQKIADAVAKDLGISKVFAGLLPADKVTKFEAIKADSQDKVAFVGDGINDAPVLAMADVGIAMGEIGSDAAIESADIVLMNDDIKSIATAKKIARKTRRIISQNVVMSLGIKIGIMGLAFFGMSSIWLALFADVGVALLAVLNALRSFFVAK